MTVKQSEKKIKIKMENILKKPCKSDTHVSSVHEGKKTLRCEMCGKTCFNMARLTEHIAAIHEGKKPFKCDICNAKFWEKRVLNKQSPFEYSCCNSSWWKEKIQMWHL